MVRELVGEVMGMSPYEKRLLDMLIQQSLPAPSVIRG